jgi:uncharacterized protein (DUF1697 family)
MTRYIAFLRAINVGGHFVKMERLRQLFESLGYTKVETFINSGNVIFESRVKNTQTLETKIEAVLSEALAYKVDTFVRTEAKLATIAAYQPFAQAAIESASTHAIGFLAAEPNEESSRRLLALRSATDDFHVNARELYWLSHHKQSQSVISGAVIEKALKSRTTLRGVNTVRQMAAKYCS